MGPSNNELQLFHLLQIIMCEFITVKQKFRNMGIIACVSEATLWFLVDDLDDASGVLV